MTGDTRIGFALAIAVVGVRRDDGLVSRPEIFGRWLDGMHPSSGGRDPHVSPVAPKIAHLKFFPAQNRRSPYAFFKVAQIRRPVWLCPDPQREAGEGGFYASTAIPADAVWGPAFDTRHAAEGGRPPLSEL